ncbi:hypothetical protein [Thioclava atlantica]|uniref:hypothetical protein n=1 Tax=Thioclava atlantica TaxID=1317124 RepID=UPI000A68AF67|nr:hypothetical protein [Thioclava atlantica]
MGALFSLATMAGSRLAMAGLAVALWLLGRPGGWAVLVVGVLLALRVFPAHGS